MMRALTMVAVAAVALAAGCSGTQQPTYRELERMGNDNQREAIARPPPDSCQMAAHQSLVGTLGASIEAASLPQGSRIVCHDCVVTMDYRAERLNVLVDVDGRVAGLRCG